MTTTDLTKIGYRERKMAAKLLIAWNKGELPEDFYEEEVTIMMNQNSGNVFLTNADSQVAMMDNYDELKSWYSCPYCGHEGFLEDMEHEPEGEECLRYLEEIKVEVYHETK